MDNAFFVSVNMRDQIIILHPPLGPLSKSQALNLAAWLAVLACNDIDSEFMPMVDEVRKS